MVSETEIVVCYRQAFVMPIACLPQVSGKCYPLTFCNTLGVLVLVFPVIFADTSGLGDDIHITMAGIMVIGLCWHMLCQDVADVTATQLC